MRELDLRKVKVILQGLTWLIQLIPNKKESNYLINSKKYLENHKNHKLKNTSIIFSAIPFTIST